MIIPMDLCRRYASEAHLSGYGSGYGYVLGHGQGCGYGYSGGSGVAVPTRYKVRSPYPDLYPHMDELQFLMLAFE